MKIYIQSNVPQRAGVVTEAGLVAARELPDGGFAVHDPEAGYSIWPGDQFEKCHRPLTRREAQLVNMSVAELEVMSISDRLPDELEGGWLRFTVEP